jgi:hypothetical protein
VKHFSTHNRIFCGLAAIVALASGACTPPPGTTPTCLVDADCAGELICRNQECIGVIPTGEGGMGSGGTCFDLRGSIVCVQASDPGGAPEGVAAVPPPQGGTPGSASLDMTGFVVGDQGGCGSCAAFATRDAMGERAITQKGSFIDFSAADIWYIAGYGPSACLDGSNIATIFSQNISRATYVVDSTTWSYDPSMPVSSLKNVPPAATLDQGGVAHVEQASSIGAHNLQDMKNAIASGWPAVIGVDFYLSSGWGSLDGRIDVPAPGSASDGGHAIMLTSYDDATQTFGFVNSWGTVFGQNGFGTMTYAFLQQYATGGVALQTLAFKGSGCLTDYCSTNHLQPGSYCDGADVVDCGTVSGCTQVTSRTTCPGGCSGGHCAGSKCGNGTKDPGEQCDGTALGGATCQSQGFDHGSLSCAPGACTLDTSACCKDQCAQGATQCGSGGTQQICGPTALGCLGWGNDVGCPYGCSAGACKPGPCQGVSCTTPPNPQCYNPSGTCSGGTCSYAPKPFGSACNDSNACTSGDVCDGNGNCVGSPVSCNSPPNSQCYATSGACSGGTCFYTPSPSGTPCNDGNPNTANDKCDGAGNCSGGCVPSVSSVSPLSATLNQLTNFTVSGTCMPNTIAPFITNCANLAVTSAGPSQATFQCTPSFATGLQSGLVKDKSGGTVLYNFNLNVQGPVVTNVTPTSATLNQLTTFTITGSNLPTTIAPFITNCANLVVMNAGPNQATFQCTPSFATGAQSGLVKDKPGGTVLYNFTLNVQPCTPIVNSVTPTSASLNQSTTFTINGSCLPSTIAPFITNCANLAVTSTGPNQATFKCTPSFATGPQSGLVKDKPGGTQLYGFTLSVN